MKTRFISFFAAAVMLSAMAHAEDVAPSGITENYDQWTLRCATVRVVAPVDDTLKKEDLGAKAKDDKPKDDKGAAPAGVEKRICTVSQQFIAAAQGAQSGQGVFVGQVAFSYDLKKAGQLNMQLDAPVQVQVDQPIKLSDGDKAFASASFHVCSGNSCSGFVENASAAAASLVASANPRMQYTLANGQAFGVNFPVKGLSSALAQLKAKQK